MKRPGCIIPLALVATLAILLLAFAYYSHTPTGAFRRHFDSIPSSVTDIERHGHTALAGSDERLVFSINKSDLNDLISRKGLKDVTALIDTNPKPRNWDILVANAGRATAAQYGITPGKFYVITKFDGLIFYLLITDAKSNRVFYQYHKT